MSYWYGELFGSRGRATKGSGKDSGLTAYLCSGNAGVYVECKNEDGVDTFRVFRTEGTNVDGTRRGFPRKDLIAKFRADE